MLLQGKKKNQICQLKDENGQWLNWESGLGDLIGSHYKTIFQSKPTVMEEVLECIGERVSSDQNDLLTQSFSAEEVKEAVFSMHPDKSPGQDSMNPAFYQRFWSIIGSDVVSTCQNILTSGIIPPNLNDTLVVLIPKKTLLKQ